MIGFIIGLVVGIALAVIVHPVYDFAAGLWSKYRSGK